ncbi:Acyl-CoA synthetase family member 3, mitochondrial [Porphyridium purpureum]|uniref:Acyl-CoA synthetase family member 3, mitochondrial n=1 Tax=Porphyridium purpureum TaxID=35688 RepID=A0A5J4YIR8_PORPP|nr:Acyl-CoA synthetase family member 3, mitochondrial [Porphyridium purpureum]|eukprot:POR7060..scf257_31
MCGQYPHAPSARSPLTICFARAAHTRVERLSSMPRATCGLNSLGQRGLRTSWTAADAFSGHLGPMFVGAPALRQRVGSMVLCSHSDGTNSAGPLIIQRARERNSQSAAIRSRGLLLTYGELLEHATTLCGVLTGLQPQTDDDRPRIAFCLPYTSAYVISQWATWLAGGIAVPLHNAHPSKELGFIIDDSDPCIVLCSKETRETIQPLCDERNITFLEISSDDARLTDRGPSSQGPVSGRLAWQGPPAHADDACLLIYTSGTTGRPKGVVWTHAMLEFWAEAMTAKWAWTPNDRITNYLPLHHVHGILNITFTALWNGALLSMEEKFSVRHAWAQLQSEENSEAPTLFMAVPTIYAYMISFYEQQPPEIQETMRQGAARLRLYVSGSAALQATYFNAWRNISGQNILERYGMSEVGMPLTNPHEVDSRREGWVGLPMSPDIEFKVVSDDSDTAASSEGKSEVGELRLRGPGIFKRYWRREDATVRSFDAEGYFLTGDVVERADDGWFRILGRSSVDIIKSGGFKISALEIERELLDHPSIAQVAVVGIPHDSLGESIAAMLVLRDGISDLSVSELGAWARERLADYKVPKQVKIVPEIPRNAMGKIEKKKVISQM